MARHDHLGREPAGQVILDSVVACLHMPAAAIPLRTAYTKQRSVLQGGHAPHHEELAAAEDILQHVAHHLRSQLRRQLLQQPSLVDRCSHRALQVHRMQNASCIPCCRGQTELCAGVRQPNLPSKAHHASLKYVAKSCLRGSGRLRACAYASTSFILLLSARARLTPELTSWSQEQKMMNIFFWQGMCTHADAPASTP